LINDIQLNIYYFIFAGGFDRDYNIIFLEDATATENETMHKVISSNNNLNVKLFKFSFIKATLMNLEYGVAKIANVNEVINWLNESKFC